MATIYRRGLIWWVSYQQNGKRVQRSLKTPDKAQAKLQKQKIEYLLSVKKPILGQSAYFGPTALKYLDDYDHPRSRERVATMKQGDELSPDEVKRILKLAEWDREYDKDRRETRAYVI